ETFPPEVNGVALTLGRLVGGLIAQGHEVSVVRPRRTALDGWGDTGPAATLVRGVPVPGYRGVWMGLPARSRLRARWRGARPDAVSVPPPGPLGWSALGAAGALGLPVVSGFHTNFHRYVRHYHAGWLAPVVTRCLRRFHNATRTTLVPTADLGA